MRKTRCSGGKRRCAPASSAQAGNAAGKIFAGGSFWKRFDQVAEGIATGYVVNYELAALPGLPQVRQVEYPDDNRRYFKKGDPILLLNYTNAPYQIVYDTIKVIDDQNALGVMHLGTFPNGLEFATFVMARQNYPFENMSIPDHDAIFADPRAVVPQSGQIEGEWAGHLIFVATPDSTLLNQVSPVLFHAAFHAGAGKFQLGGIDTPLQCDCGWLAPPRCSAGARCHPRSTTSRRWKAASRSRASY